MDTTDSGIIHYLKRIKELNDLKEHAVNGAARYGIVKPGVAVKAIDRALKYEVQALNQLITMVAP